MEKIKINAIVELAGKPEEHIKETMNKMVDILDKNDKIEIIKKETAPTKLNELENPNNPGQKVEIFSTFTDLEIDFPDLDELMQFIFNFMPSSIEIIEPEKLEINQKNMENALNDLLGKLHEHSRVIMEYQALRKQIMQAQQQTTSQKKK